MIRLGTKRTCSGLRQIGVQRFTRSSGGEATEAGWDHLVKDLTCVWALQRVTREVPMASEQEKAEPALTLTEASPEKSWQEPAFSSTLCVLGPSLVLRFNYLS